MTNTNNVWADLLPASKPAPARKAKIKPEVHPGKQLEDFLRETGPLTSRQICASLKWKDRALRNAIQLTSSVRRVGTVYEPLANRGLRTTIELTPGYPQPRSHESTTRALVAYLEANGPTQFIELHGALGLMKNPARRAISYNPEIFTITRKLHDQTMDVPFALYGVVKNVQ